MPACEACGGVLPPGAAFCPQCGHRVSGPARPTAAELMRSERKLVTVLFADIKGSIDLVARRDPEQAGEVLARVVREMGDAVRRCGGTVNQVMGDGIMALFGAPRAMEDHARQACAAALDMRRAVHERVQPRVQVRVGISSGEVVVSAMEGDVALHYSAAGEAVHLASRMEQLAGPDQIVLTPATLHLAGGLVGVRTLGMVPVKGLDAPLEAWELLHLLERRQPQDAAPRQRGFVGRAPLMAALQDAKDHAASGEARAVRLVGDAGAGKSRLVQEFTHTHLGDEWLLCRAEAVPHRQTSYAVMGELLGGLFGLGADDPVQIRREKVVAGLAVPSRDRSEDLVAPIYAVLGLRPFPPGWEALSARERRDRVVDGAARAFQRVSVRQPTALVLEDAHWLDPESADCVQRLAHAVPGQRMLALATERPGPSAFAGTADWWDVPVPALDEAGTHDLLTHLLLPGAEAAALERRLIEHTRGNPLFIEECLESLAETGELERDGGRFRVSRTVGALRVPDSLRGLLDARVDRLATADKDVLQAAAVIGTRVKAGLLQDVLDMPEAELSPSLQRLCHSGFLVPDGAGPGRYAFRHGLIRDSAYGGMLLRSRMRMHRSVLAALERQPGAVETEVDLLADHASKAEAWPQAVTYSRAAASRAFDRYANPEAARFYGQALDAAGQWAEGPERDRVLLDLHIAIRWPLFRLGHLFRLRPHLDQAISLARRQDDHALLGHGHILRSHVLWLAGEPGGAMDAAEAARAIGRANGDAALQVRSEFQAALVHLTQSEVAPLVASLDTVLAHLGGTPPAKGPYGLDSELAVTCLSYVARAHAAAGRFAEADRAVEAATAMAQQAQREQDWIYVGVAEGVARLAEWRPAEAVRALEGADERCRRLDIRLLRPVVAGFLALAYVEAGQTSRGLTMALEAVAEAERMEFLALHPMRLAILAQAYLVTGDVDGGEREAARARDLSIRIKEPGAEAYAVGLLGEARLRRGDADGASALFAAGLAQAESLGLLPLARCLRQRLEQPGNRAHPWLDGIGLAP